MSFNVEKIRADFPILSRKVNGKDLVYLDNAATSLKPKQVVDVISQHYLMETANVHRGVHFLSAQATDRYEEARRELARFVNAPSERNIVFTSGTTASLNLVAISYGGSQLQAGDEVLLSEQEHHSNLVPWQILAEQKSLKLRFIAVQPDGSLDLDSFVAQLSSKTKLVSINMISNSTGVIHPYQEIISRAHSVGAKVCLDGAQASCHMPLDVQTLDCDFLALSAHKMLGPTGIGLLYAKEDLLQKMPPIFGGGDMIERVRLEGSTWNDIPFKFEAGTPHIAGVLGFAEAARYLQKIGFSAIADQEQHLYELAKRELGQIPGLKIYGDSEHKVAVFAFGFEGVHPSDLGTILDQYGIAVRTGHHCTQPLMEKWNVPGTTRASFSFYNNDADVHALVSGLKKAKEFLL